jgi:hypothetical protein
MMKYIREYVMLDEASDQDPHMYNQAIMYRTFRTATSNRGRGTLTSCMDKNTTTQSHIVQDCEQKKDLYLLVPIDLFQNS